jgi:hypothetical protein
MNASSSPNGLYDARFFSYTSLQSLKSAQAIVPILRQLLPEVNSVADFGCAQGVWLKCWMDNGMNDIQGVDGDYVDRATLAVPVEFFHARDLNKPIDLERRFDLACSLEVAEHLQPENSEQFIHALTRHADIVLFSAAPPGQGGESHINERPFDSWREMFRAKGYAAYDCVRPLIAGSKDVSYWYRYNILLYVHSSAVSSLSAETRTTWIADDEKIADISQPLFRARKFLVNLLPYRLQNMLARAKARAVKN